MKLSGFLLGLFVTTLALRAEGEGVVTVDILKVRERPDLTAATVHSIKRGTIVLIIGESQSSIKIDGIEAPWLQIESEGKQGWSFGGYIATNFRKLGSDHLAWGVYPPGAPYESGFTIVLYNTRTRKEIKATSSNETADYAFSENLRFLATDEGTDVSGGIKIIDLQNKGKVLVDSSYMPRGVKWKGNTLIFNDVVCFDDGFAITQEKEFANGKLVNSGQYDKTGFHVGVDIGGCKNHMRKLPRNLR